MAQVAVLMVSRDEWLARCVTRLQELGPPFTTSMRGIWLMISTAHGRKSSPSMQPRYSRAGADCCLNWREPSDLFARRARGRKSQGACLTRWSLNDDQDDAEHNASADDVALHRIEGQAALAPAEEVLTHGPGEP